LGPAVFDSKRGAKMVQMLGSFLGKIGVRVGEVWEFWWDFWEEGQG
jgi:hypothetical protein